MSAPVSIRRLRNAIASLPSDKPRKTEGKWYLTQKEHWLGWLAEYHGPGYYGRKDGTRRDAEFAYNHIVEVKMLLWLAGAAGVSPRVMSRARAAERAAATLQAKAGAFRKVVPWKLVQEKLWPVSSTQAYHLVAGGP